MNRREFIKAAALAGAALASGTTGCGASPLDSESGLRSLAKNLFPIGVSLQDPSEGRYTANELENLSRHFDIITPEMAMKWERCQPDPNTYQFKAADKVAQLAKANRQKLLGHTLLFNRAKNYPEWIFADGADKASAKVVENRLRDYIRTIVGRYRGDVYAWDVVNEAVQEQAPFYRETDWYRTFGGTFVPLAFRLAKEVDPGALRIYNDFNIEVPRKRERVLLLLEELKREGVMPDVVGIQGHWELDDVPFENIEQSIVELHQAGVRVSVTELDIDVISRKKYWSLETRPDAVKQNPYVDGCPAAILERQAEQYGQLFELFVKHAEKMERVTIWGLNDRHSWLNAWPWPRVDHGLLFDRDNQPKPAFHAVAKALRAGQKSRPA